MISYTDIYFCKYLVMYLLSVRCYSRSCWYAVNKIPAHVGLTFLWAREIMLSAEMKKTKRQGSKAGSRSGEWLFVTLWVEWLRSSTLLGRWPSKVPREGREQTLSGAQVMEGKGRSEAALSLGSWRLARSQCGWSRGNQRWGLTAHSELQLYSEGERCHWRGLSKREIWGDLLWPPWKQTVWGKRGSLIPVQRQF